MIAKNKNTATKKVHPAVLAMAPAARESYDKLREVYETATRNELLKRHEIGTIVDELMSDESKYGQNILTQLSAALGVGNDYLYRSRKLARIWTSEEVEKLRKRTNKFGQRIEFTHLWLVANLAASKTRASLIEEFFRDGLTTRELEERIQKLLAKSDPNKIRRPKTPAAGMAAMRRWAEEYVEKSSVWGEVVFAPLEDVSPNGDSPRLEDVIATKSSQEELLEQVEKNIAKLEKCLELEMELREEQRKAKRRTRNF